MPTPLACSISTKSSALATLKATNGHLALLQPPPTLPALEAPQLEPEARSTMSTPCGRATPLPLILTMNTGNNMPVTCTQALGNPNVSSLTFIFFCHAFDETMHGWRFAYAFLASIFFSSICPSSSARKSLYRTGRHSYLEQTRTGLPVLRYTPPDSFILRSHPPDCWSCIPHGKWVPNGSGPFHPLIHSGLCFREHQSFLTLLEIPHLPFALLTTTWITLYYIQNVRSTAVRSQRFIFFSSSGRLVCRHEQSYLYQRNTKGD